MSVADDVVVLILTTTSVFLGDQYHSKIANSFMREHRAVA